MGASASCCFCLDKQEKFHLKGLDVKQHFDPESDDEFFEERSPLDWSPSQVQEWLASCVGIAKGAVLVGLSGKELVALREDDVKKLAKKDELWNKLVAVRRGLVPSEARRRSSARWSIGSLTSELRRSFGRRSSLTEGRGAPPAAIFGAPAQDSGGRRMQRTSSTATRSQARDSIPESVLEGEGGADAG